MIQMGIVFFFIRARIISQGRRCRLLSGPVSVILPIFIYLFDNTDQAMGVQKMFKKAVSLILASSVFLTANVLAMGCGTPAAAASELPEGAYTQDATWADNSPVGAELPPPAGNDGPMPEGPEYIYTPRMERLLPPGQQEDSLSGGNGAREMHIPDMDGPWGPAAMAPGEKAGWVTYTAILNERNYYSDLPEKDTAFLCGYAGVSGVGLEALERTGLALIDSLPYAQAAFEFDMPAELLAGHFTTPAGLFFFAAQMRAYLRFINEGLRGSGTDTVLRGYLLEGYALEQVLPAYGVGRALGIGMEGLLTDKYAGRVMLKGGRYLYVGFMCHQVIEKALKSVIARDCADGEIPL